MSKIELDDSQMLSVPIGEVRKAVEKICTATGLSVTDSATLADAMTLSLLRGIDTHGVRALPNYIKRFMAGSLNPVPKMKILRETPVSAVIDADNAIGHVSGAYAMKLAIDKAKNTGVGMTAVRNSNHFGMTAYFSMMAQKEGMIGFACTNASARMAPSGGKTACYGNNPWSFAFPYAEGDVPIVVDMANSVVANSNINIAKKLGKKIPVTWALTKDGEITDNPNEAVLLQPFGGYKGYALSVVSEAFASGLSGSAFSKDTGTFNSMESGQNLGHFFMALDIGLFAERGEFEQRMRDFCTAIHASEPAVNSNGVFLPGEMEYQRFKAQTESGCIKIPQQYVEDLIETSKNLGVDVSFSV